MAVSLETEAHYHLSHSEDIDFKTAGYFTGYFAKLLLEKKLSTGVDLIKVEVPAHATPKTEWQMSRLSRHRYYEPFPVERESWDVPGSISYRHDNNLDNEPEDTDVYVLRKKKMIAVTPIDLDMTARVDLSDFEKFLRK